MEWSPGPPLYGNTTMPRKPEMTWVPGRGLGRKMYRGKVYTVSCRQLREQGYDVISDTKEGSYPAANAWWHKKEHELWEAERQPARPLTPLEQTALAALGLRPGEPAPQL